MDERAKIRWWHMLGLAALVVAFGLSALQWLFHSWASITPGAADRTAEHASLSTRYAVSAIASLLGLMASLRWLWQRRRSG